MSALQLEKSVVCVVDDDEDEKREEEKIEDDEKNNNVPMLHYYLNITQSSRVKFLNLYVFVLALNDLLCMWVHKLILTMWS